MDAICELCGVRPGTSRDVPLRTVVCDGCWNAALIHDDDPADPEPVGGINLGAVQQLLAGLPHDTAPPLAPCRDCGLDVQWLRTVNGKGIAAEPGLFSQALIPEGKRWRDGPGGILVRIPPNQPPAGKCRLVHWEVCPSRQAPYDQYLALLRRLAWQTSAQVCAWCGRWGRCRNRYGDPVCLGCDSST